LIQFRSQKNVYKRLQLRLIHASYFEFVNVMKIQVDPTIFILLVGAAIKSTWIGAHVSVENSFLHKWYGERRPQFLSVLLEHYIRPHTCGKYYLSPYFILHDSSDQMLTWHVPECSVIHSFSLLPRLASCISLSLSLSLSLLHSQTHALLFRTESVRCRYTLC
jgi:hypothetical protein